MMLPLGMVRPRTSKVSLADSVTSDPSYPAAGACRRWALRVPLGQLVTEMPTFARSARRNW